MSQLQFQTPTPGFSKRAVNRSFSRLVLAVCMCSSALTIALSAAASEPTPVGKSSEKSPSSENLSASELTAILKEHEQKTGSKVSHVIGAGPQVTIMALPASPTTNDRDLKIDAVFLAKTLIDSASSQIERIDVIFARADESKVISIDKKAIQVYGQGNTNPEDFLRTLHLKAVNPEELPAIEPGPLRERRLLISERIEKLRKTGTGIKPFQDIFQSIENAIKGGDIDKLSTKLEDLEDKLTAQEEQVASARRTSLGHGLSLVPSKSSDMYADVTLGEKMVKTFDERAAKAILRAKSPLDAQKLIDLKRRIDDDKAKGRKGEALSLVEEFWKIAGEDASRFGQFNRQRNENSGSNSAVNAPLGGRRRGAQW